MKQFINSLKKWFKSLLTIDCPECPGKLSRRRARFGNGNQGYVYTCDTCHREFV